MPLQRNGRDLIAGFLVSTGVNATAYGATGAYFAVGNSSAAHSSSSTWLEGTSTMISMDATYPQRASNVITFRGTFTTAMANFQWWEWGIWNATSTGSASGSLLNRKLEDPSLGTKTSAQSWQITADLTLTT
jgi:hypothetical protein